MAEYKSSYTGEQIDGGIAKANTAVQPADLSSYQAKIDSSNKLSADLITDGETNKIVTASDKNDWSGKQDALISGTNIKTINDNSILGEGNLEIQSSAPFDVKEINYSNPDDWDANTDQPTEAVIDDVASNNYNSIHVTGIPISENVEASTYFYAQSTATDNVQDTIFIKSFTRFDEGDAEEQEPAKIVRIVFTKQYEDGDYIYSFEEEDYILGGSSSL